MPYRFLFPAIMTFCCIGLYTLNNNNFDVYMAACSAVVGYVFYKLGCEPAPLLLGFILGPMMEENLRRALLLSRGDWTTFLTRPLSAGLLIAAALMIVVVALPSIKAKRAGGVRGSRLELALRSASSEAPAAGASALRLRITSLRDVSLHRNRLRRCCTMLRCSMSATPQDTDLGALAPLRNATFRMLWLAWLAANISMWMNDVAAAWLMTTLTTSPAMVALVQTASTLPVFLLGLPSGALADIVDRRRYFAGTQLWVAAIALLLMALALAGKLSAPMLLLLTFLNGITWRCAGRCSPPSCPSLVPRAQLLGGARRSTARDERVARRRPGDRRRDSGEPGQRAGVRAQRGAVGGRLRHHPALEVQPQGRARCRANASSARCGWACSTCGRRRACRSCCCASACSCCRCRALMALLPLLAKELPGGGAGAFSALLGATGLGAVATVAYMGRAARAFRT